MEVRKMEKKKKVPKKMKRGMVLSWLIVCVMLCLLAGGCTQPQQEQPTEEKNIAECDKISDPCDRADCVGEIAVATNDMSLCNMLSAKGEYCPYYACVDYVAEETKDVSLCEDVSVEQVKEWCMGTVAGETRDVSLCEQISATNEKDHCFKEVAEATKDLSLCDKIHFDYWKDRCVEAATQ
jgi:hypothetical protein